MDEFIVVTFDRSRRVLVAVLSSPCQGIISRHHWREFSFNQYMYGDTHK